MILLLFLLSSVLVFLFVYFGGRYNENYWKRRGVRFHDQNKLTGPFWDYMTRGKPLFQAFHDMYKQYPDEPAVGFGSLFSPTLYVKDKTNVQFLMQSPQFSDRGFEYNVGDRLADNVLFMNGIRWKLMRQKLTPLFTTAKLKNMYYIVDKSAQDFIEYLRNNPDKLNGNSFFTLCTFCCAAIGAAVFGVGSKSTFDSPFLEPARGAFFPTFMGKLRFSISNISPLFYKILNLQLFKKYEEFFFGAMKQVFRHREQEGEIKHDFADLCVSIQKEGVMKHQETGFEMDPSDELLAAQGFFFFIAGVEPAATAMFGALIEIGRNEEIQNKLCEEIDDIFDKHNNKLNYDAVMELKYLDKVLSESLRIFPPIGYLTRRCVEDTVLPVGNIKIQKGTKVFTPIYEYHHDPEFFRNPEVFDPERFTDDAKQSMGITYMPFGYGPRVCIGVRYALIQVKAGVAHVLRNFNLKTHVHKGGIKYGQDQVQLKMKNVDIEFIHRI